MGRKRPSLTERTAYHEAGHAVAAYLRGRRLTNVSIVADEEALGRARHEERRSRPPLYADTDTKQRTRVETAIITTLAGHAAEDIFVGRSLTTRGAGAKPDWQTAFDFAATATGSVEETSAYVNWLWVHTKDLLEFPPHWSAVRALASKLLVRHRLRGRTARALIRNAISEGFKALAGQDE